MKLDSLNRVRDKLRVGNVIGVEIQDSTAERNIMYRKG
jgi:hypothetical protein